MKFDENEVKLNLNER